MTKVSGISFQSSLLENLKNAQQIDVGKNSAPASTGNNENSTTVEQNSGLGVEALSNYNRANISKNSQLAEAIKPYILEPLEAKPVEKDFKNKTKVTPADDSVYYEDVNGDITTIYHSIDGSDILSTRIEVNNKTGNKIREDVYDKDGNPMSVVVFNPETGIRKKCTCFNDVNHKPDFISEYNDDGECTVSNFYDNDGKLTDLSYLDKGADGNSKIYYEIKDAKIAYRHHEDINGNRIETVKYVNGQEKKAFKPVHPPVINTTNIDYKFDIKPLDIGDIELDISKINGEKIYRSNSTLEEIKTKIGNLERNYIIDDTGNKITGIYETENGKFKRRITIDSEFGTVDTILEVLEDSDDKYHSKRTCFDEKGNVVNIWETLEEKPDTSEMKGINFDKYGNISSYFIENRIDKTHTAFEVNENGELIDISKWEEYDKLHNEFYHDVIDHSENIADKPDADKNFNEALNDEKWEKKYDSEDNCVTMTCPQLKDGPVYHIFDNGTVACHSCWTGDNTIIKNSNEETAKIFNEIKQK